MCSVTKLLKRDGSSDTHHLDPNNSVVLSTPSIGIAHAIDPLEIREIGNARKTKNIAGYQNGKKLTKEILFVEKVVKD